MRLPLGGGGGVSGPARYFYGGLTWNGLAFTPSQNAPQGEQTLEYKTCVNIPPSCPIHRLSKVKIHQMAPLGATTTLVWGPAALSIVPTLVLIAEGNYSSSGLAS